MARTLAIRPSGAATTGNLGATTPAATPGQFHIRTTAPAALVRHNISDEELDALASSKREGLSEVMWSMVALATGAAPSASEALWKSYITNPAVPLSALSLLQIVLFVAGAVLAVGSLALVMRRGRAAKDLVVEIRTRAAS